MGLSVIARTPALKILNATHPNTRPQRSLRLDFSYTVTPHSSCDRAVVSSGPVIDAILGLSLAQREYARICACGYQVSQHPNHTPLPPNKEQ